MKLTAKTVAALRLDGKRDLIVFDSELSGFGYRLRLGASGKTLRSWVCQYRRAGVSRRLLLGSADVLSAEKARAAARTALAKIALGQDPQADKVARRDKDRLTLRGMVDEYLAAKQPQVRPRTFVEVTRYLTGSYFKPLHAMAIDTVTRRDVASRLVVITRESGSVTAARARAALSAFFTWAMRMGIIESNPVIGTIKPHDHENRTRVLTDAELAAIWHSCGDNDIGHIVRLLILMPYRRSEVGGMRWSELDLERGLFTLPAARAKNNREHILPLMPMALDIIKAVPRMATRDHLFGVRGNGFTGWGSKAALDARSGVTAPPWSLHDIRRSVATHMADIGVPPHVVEQILNHQSGHKSGIAGIYNRSSYQREVRSALALWHDHVRILIEGGERKVLPLHQTAS